MKNKKHPSEMTADEAMEHIFHPKVVEELKRHVKELNDKPAKSKKKGATK